MSARKEVAAHIATAQPAWKVWNHGRDLDGVTRTTVMVEQTTVKPGASQGLRSVSLTISLVVPGNDPSRVEDALEAALDKLLDALDPLPYVQLTAERGTTQNATLPAYAVTIEVPVRKDPS